jgi:isopenicillin N synthase-like dioxygenase
VTDLRDAIMSNRCLPVWVSSACRRSANVDDRPCCSIFFEMQQGLVSPVSLAQLGGAGSMAAAAAIADALEKQGWCFLLLPPALVSLLASAAIELDEFFAQDATAKRGCAAFNETSRKEGLRCLTGPRVPQLPCPVLPRAIKELDGWMALTADAVFGSDFDNRSDLPLLADVAGFGMFDAVRYYNSAEDDEHELNCEAHVDAGLVSLSVLSTAAGLQMLAGDKKTWIDVPLHLGVVWAGTSAVAASRGRFQPAYHRVRKCDQPRLTVWTEVCCRAQAESALIGSAPPAAANAAYATVVVSVRNLLGRVWETTVTVAADAYSKTERKHSASSNGFCSRLESARCGQVTV